MEFIDYPMALYRDGEYILVADAEDEEARRAERWTDWGADQERMTTPADSAEETIDAALDRDALKAKAAELGIAYARTITTPKLAELVEAATKG